MSHYKPRTASTPSEPHRALAADFTARTIRYAKTAKRRMETQQQFKAFLKEPFSMKSLKFLRTLPGAAIVAATVITTTGVGAYTIANWFGATADNARQEGNVLSVDISGCNRDLPNVPRDSQGTAKFEVTGTPHISSADLQAKLLAGCEFYEIFDFYTSNSPYREQLTGSYQDAQSFYQIGAGTVKQISDNTITLAYRVLGAGDELELHLNLANDATVYQHRQPASKADLIPGDHVVFVYELPGSFNENFQKYGPTFSTLPPSAATVLSLHKASTDIKNSIALKDFYQINNVKPLGWEEKAPQH